VRLSSTGSTLRRRLCQPRGERLLPHLDHRDNVVGDLRGLLADSTGERWFPDRIGLDDLGT